MDKHRFNRIYIDGELFDGFHIVNKYQDFGCCKRCGKSLEKKYMGQIFCSRKCVSRYRNKMKAMKEKYGKAFTDWLNDEIDYSYAPERF